MALNLSTLTSPATSGDVLAEALTTADFLEPVPVLRNLARGSQKGGDAKQGTALNQPKALPLIGGDGYLYVSGVTGNYASTPDHSSLDISSDILIDVDLTCLNWVNGNYQPLVSKYDFSDDGRGYLLWIRADGKLQWYISEDGTASGTPSVISSAAISFSGRQRGKIRAVWNNSTNTVQFFTSSDNGETYTQLGSDLTRNATGIFNSNEPLIIGTSMGIYSQTGMAFHSVKIYDSVTPSSSSLRFNIDFTATNIRHGDTKIKCSTGQVVTINQSGNDPATIIKKSVLRFDGVNDGLRGLFNQTITEGYIFVAFTVLGDGGKGHNGRVFSLNSTGGTDNDSTGYITGYGANPAVLHSYSGSNFTNTVSHSGLYSEENGDILHEHKFSAGAQLGKVNNADVNTGTTNLSLISSEEFNVGLTTSGVANAAIDLEYLALFPASITDAQADSVRNYINNRNNVFDLKDGFGYYFFESSATSNGQVFSSGAYPWNGRIVGSDNGDTNRYLFQETLNDRPTSDGYKITFADNTDHFNIASTTQAGWQIVGTSLGTFAYRVNANAVTEINLLGNAGGSRSIGELYGMILLPESASAADVESARRLLIDRGAADGTTASSYQVAWYLRSELKEFKSVNMTGVTNVESAWQQSGLTSFSTPLPAATNVSYAWQSCTSLTSFSTQLPLATSAVYAWYQNTSLSDFRTTDIKNSTNFTSAWQNCSALTSFPEGAKLGTEANNVNFTSAWQSSGLTSFPADIDLSKGAVFNNAFNSCTSLSSFPSIDLSQGTHFSFTWYNTALTEFPYISFEKARTFYAAWYINNSLVDFASGCFNDWNPDSIENNCFGFAFVINNLSSQSVENILVSIDSSGQHATTDGTSNTNPITGTNIDLKYNVATGSLSAATTAAITSLKSKGWVIVVNGVTL